MTRPELFTLVTFVSIVLFAGSIAMIPWFVARIPAEYFKRQDDGPPSSMERHGLGAVAHVAKNVLGAALLLLGLAMLVLPGQGLLTILVALVLLDFPGKRRLECWLVKKPRVLSTLNALRRRRHKPPLVLG